MAVAPPTPGVRTRRAAAAEAEVATKGGRGARTANGANATANAGPFLFPALKPLLRLAARSLVLIWLAVVWLWHLTPAASVLPGASGYLWFCRYLTFYSFSLQLLGQALAFAHDAQRHRHRRNHAASAPKKTTPPSSFLAALSRWADDLGCAAFCLAHVVTLMFHLIQSATGGKAVEGAHIDRPPWLDASVHRLNTAAAWLDVALITPRGGRSFSRSGEKLSACLVALYCLVLLSARLLNGAFPYPFMNAMGQPHGYLIVCGFGMVIFGAAFKLGRLIAGGIRAAEDWAVARVEEAAAREAAAAAAQEEEEEEEEERTASKSRGGARRRK
jgi:hypothetical protein